MGKEVLAPTYAAAIQRLQHIISEEIRQKKITGVSVAMVDDQSLVYAGGFGMADEERAIPAGAETVYRTGSVSKLFNALAVMQLVEQGQLDLDTPVTQYDPEFSIVVPFTDAPPITLRQVLCHRSGMIREAPVGSYFDSTTPSVEASVHSVAPCVLVNPPTTQTRYSNVGPTLAGYIVSKVSGLDYEEYQQRHILGPMGMTRSTFRTHVARRTGFARGYMDVVQPGGTFRREPAPEFEIGTIPAGNQYASAPDVARLALMVFGNGCVAGRQIVQPETLKEMLRPQLIDGPIGFGLGFNLTKFGERTLVSHNGAVYGFSSTIAMLPDAKVGVVVLANDDVNLGPVRMIVETALELLLEAKLGEKPAPRVPLAVAPEQLARLAGEYESTSYWASLSVVDGQLRAVVSGQPLTLVATGPLKFVAEGRWQWRAEFAFSETPDGQVHEFQALTQKFHRVNPTAVQRPPERWNMYLGSYGPPFIPLMVSLRNGNLYAFTENMLDYRLTPINQTVFAMPPGLYTDEQLVFQVGPDGDVYAATLANVELKRLH